MAQTQFSLVRTVASAMISLLLAHTTVHAQTAVRVGSKIDTEGSLLGQLILQTLEANGIKTVITSKRSRRSPSASSRSRSLCDRTTRFGSSIISPTP